MFKRSFSIEACWDDEAQVFYSKSDIKGLHIEAATIEEFEDIMHEVAIELIIANHVTAEQVSSTPMRNLVPSIFWNRPDAALACA